MVREKPASSAVFHPRLAISTGEPVLRPLPEAVSFPPYLAWIGLLPCWRGGEVTLEGGSAFRHTLKRYQPFGFAGEQTVRAQLSEGQMSMDLNIMTRRERCQAKVRVADRSFTTFGARGGMILVLSGAWQVGDKLLTADQGACWQEGHHIFRLLQETGQLLYSEIRWQPGYASGAISQATAISLAG